MSGLPPCGWQLVQQQESKRQEQAAASVLPQAPVAPTPSAATVIERPSAVMPSPLEVARSESLPHQAPAPAPSSKGSEAPMAEALQGWAKVKRTVSISIDIPVEDDLRCEVVLQSPTGEAAAAAAALAEAPDSPLCHADTSLCNVAMFSGYRPALTHHVNVTPILYAGYLVAWKHAAAGARAAAAVASALRASALALARSSCGDVVMAAGWATRALLAPLSRLGLKCTWKMDLSSGGLLKTAQESREHLDRPAVNSDGEDEQQGSLLSFPLTLDQGSPSPSGAGRSGPLLKCKSSLVPEPPQGPLSRSDSMTSVASVGGRRRSLASRVLKVAAVAARAAGVPLLASLTGRLPIGTAAGREPPCSPLGLPTAAAPRRSMSVSGQADKTATPVRRVDAALQRGLRRCQRARTLMHLTFGWHPPAYDNEPHEQPHAADPPPREDRIRRYVV